jgi:hypothetical protein
MLDYTVNCIYLYFECIVVGPVPGGLGSDCSSSKCSPGGADSGDPLKDEPGDFIETNCHWRECGLEFPTQDDLVKVTNLSFYITYVTLAYMQKG